MSVLPRLLYLFQCLPIHLPATFLKSLISSQTKFIWGNKPARIRRELLYRPKERGGVGLPDIRKYYWAAQLAHVLDWCRNHTNKQWVSIEQTFTEIPLRGLPWLPPASLTSLKKHPTIGPAIRVCAEKVIRQHSLPLDSPLTPVLGHPDFPPSLSDRVYREWIHNDKFRVRDFVRNKTWLPATDIAALSDPRPLGPWRVAQIRHYLLSMPNPTQLADSLTSFESLCNGTTPLRHGLSLSYQALLSTPEEHIPDFMLKWEAELSITLTTEDRSKIYLLTHKSSISSRFQEAGYKILSRWYRVPTRLHALIPEIDPSCWRCDAEEGTFLHIFWSCSRLNYFWSEVIRVIRLVTDLQIPMGPALFLLHHCQLSFSAYKRSLLRFLVMAARSCIPLLWKQKDPPSTSLWITKVNDLMHMEDLTSSLQDKPTRFSATWLPWMQFQGTDAYRELLRSTPPG